jgi:glycosyltransferase involved in cell wall biosynthesis
LGQTHRPIEIIVIDDGSTDQTGELISRWAQRHERPDMRVSYLYQENRGPSAARNRGIREATGKYVQFLDSDDLLIPERFSILEKRMEASDADLALTGFEGFDYHSGEVLERIAGPAGDTPINLAVKATVWGNTLRAVFRRSLLDKIGPWREDLCCAEDREYVDRAIAGADRIEVVTEISARARRNGPDRVSDRLETYAGRSSLLSTEAALASATLARADVSDAARRAFVSRLYHQAILAAAHGWTDLSEESARLAAEVEVRPCLKGQMRKIIFRCGPPMSRVYGVLWSLKSGAGSPVR